ncbi:HIRAN domain-containing protein [Cryptosporangium minutisporangium]|uniref:HIRAN domain-containing protein n=1 Tax=Cryptosporangium minutisporangium TaxID=113569 RepID=A0ABP6T142_9ACTN
MSQVLELWGQRGWASQEVVGESHHVAAIRRLFGPVLPDDGADIEVPALLLPNPNNRYDRNAIEVRCESGLVGHLPREDAARYAPVLTELVRQGWSPQITAAVWCGYDYEYHFDDRRDEPVRRQRGEVGRVRLRLAEPHLLVPLNLPPAEAHVCLPAGSSIQVTGEEKYLSVLHPFLRPEGEAWVYATVHELTEQRPRSTRTVAEVRIDGRAVGTLTPKMSAELLPAVSFLAEQGRVTAARAIVKGNRLKADVTLHAARAGELSHEWLERMSRGGGAVRVHSDDLNGGGPPVEPRPVPARATVRRFNPPPGWPEPPPGWVPPEGWQPDPRWPAPPRNWAFWLPA